MDELVHAKGKLVGLAKSQLTHRIQNALLWIQFWIHIKWQSLKKRISKISVGLRKEHLDVLMPGTSRGVPGNVAAAPDLPAFSVGDARTTCPLVPPNPKEEIEAVAWCRKKAILFTNIDVHDSEPKMHANAKNIKLSWFASGSSIHISIIINSFPLQSLLVSIFI